MASDCALSLQAPRFIHDDPNFDASAHGVDVGDEALLGRLYEVVGQEQHTGSALPLRDLRVLDSKGGAATGAGDNRNAAFARLGGHLYYFRILVGFQGKELAGSARGE
jgi:hypothetical protein